MSRRERTFKAALGDTLSRDHKVAAVKDQPAVEV